MAVFIFDLQRFMDPGFTEYTDRPGCFYWNTVPGAVVTGVAGYPLNNWGNNAVIYLGAANDINNSGAGSKIYSNDKAHLIDNVASNVYIDAGGGADTVLAGNPSEFNVTVFGGADNDEIGFGGNKFLINGDAGNDYIYNRGGHNATINGGLDNDLIENFEGEKVFIDAGNDEGCDTVRNYGSFVTISTGAGMDYITNDHSNVEINAGVGNDEIHNYAGEKIFIDAGSGDDKIHIYITARSSQSRPATEIILFQLVEKIKL